MPFNPESTKQAIEIIFSQKRKEGNHPPLFFNGLLVTRELFHKHLGLILDSKLTFIEHVNEKVRIAKRFIGILKYLNNYLPTQTLSQIYKMYVRPHLDYGDVIYHISHSESIFDSSISLHPLMEKVEQVQYYAALAITGCWRGSNRYKLYEELGWETLSDRRWSRRLIQLYKISNDMTPRYLKDNLPSQQKSCYRSKDPNKLQDFFCRTTRYMNSFFPDAVRSWNNIGVEFCSSNSLALFKKSILGLIRPNERSVFGIHDPIGLKFIFQLRLGLSPLKCHKRRHNFADTPCDRCDCGCSPEDTAHFLNSCILHNAHRLILRDSVLNILMPKDLQNLSDNFEFYLYGHSLLTELENKNILLSTIKFIKNSNRFT